MSVAHNYNLTLPRIIFDETKILSEIECRQWTNPFFFLQFPGERLIQYASENLVTEILIHPQYNTLIQCMRNLLSSFTRHRHIIHAGYTFSGNGSWILQVRQMFLCFKKNWLMDFYFYSNTQENIFYFRLKRESCKAQSVLEITWLE